MTKRTTRRTDRTDYFDWGPDDLIWVRTPLMLKKSVSKGTTTAIMEAEAQSILNAAITQGRSPTDEETAGIAGLGFEVIEGEWRRM